MGLFDWNYKPEPSPEEELDTIGKAILELAQNGVSAQDLIEIESLLWYHKTGEGEGNCNDDHMYEPGNYQASY